jgi:hypothetical protein
MNVMAIRSHIPGTVDIRWDDPGSLPANISFPVKGVNVYRAFDSHFGPYVRLNEAPIQAAFWRDHTQLEWVHGEIVTNDRWIYRGDQPTSEPGWLPAYIFQTKHPFVKADTRGYTTSNPDHLHTSDPRDVTVTIDDVPVAPTAVVGASGEVSLQVISDPEPLTETITPSRLPGPDSVVRCSYWRVRQAVRTDLWNRIFYRVTTVAEVDGQLVETPLTSDQVKTATPLQTEPLDYVWEEAVRRNRWIAYQGGERVKVFIRKANGALCSCVDLNHRQLPKADCGVCFGTSIRGGYEGPYEIIVPPDESPKEKRWQATGITPSQVRSVWTGPVPLLSQRDFIVHQNGDRYAIGPVTTYTARGAILQQHFDMSMLGELDIRYKVPIAGTDLLAYPETRTASPTGGDNATDQLIHPQITEDINVPDGHEHRGNTPTFENIRHDG